MGLWEESGKEAEDRVRRNRSDVDYNKRADYHNENVVDPRNKFVDDNPEYAREHGIEKLNRVEKKEINELAHLKDEMVASSYKNVHYSDRELKSFVNRHAAMAHTLAASLSSDGSGGITHEQWMKNKRKKQVKPLYYVWVVLMGIGFVAGLVEGLLGILFLAIPLSLAGFVDGWHGEGVIRGCVSCFWALFGGAVGVVLLASGVYWLFESMHIQGWIYKIIMTLVVVAMYAIVGWITRRQIFKKIL